MHKNIKNTILISSVLIAFALIGADKIFAALSVLFNGLVPVFIGIVVSLLLNRPYEYLRTRFTLSIKNDKIKKWTPAFSVIIVYTAFIALIAVFFLLIAPQLVQSIEIFYSNADSYLMSIRKAINEILRALPFDIADIEITEQSIAEFLFKGELPITKLAEGFMQLMRKLSVFVVNAGVGIVLSVYLLASKERIKSQLAVFANSYLSEKGSLRFLNFISTTCTTFSVYLSAQLFEALILFVLCYAGMLAFGFEYPLVISAIVGVTNMIPMIGPFIGAVPGVIICLLATPSKTVWFILFIFAVQQLENNIIAPKVVGDSIGFAPVWVFASLVISGAFFGIGAMFICVPAFTVIYKLLKQGALNKRKG